MAIRINQKVPPESTAGFSVSFFDENRDAVVPNAITWTLFNGRSIVVNAREAVAVTPTGTSATIVMSGDDLKYSDGGDRYLLIEFVYDSDLGENLPARNEVVFTLAKLVE